MDYREFVEKNGNNIDWSAVDDDELYAILDDSRAVWETLYEEGVLPSHPLYKVVRDRCIRSLYFLSLFCWDANPFGGPDTPISENLATKENLGRIFDMFVKKDPKKSIAQQSNIKNRLILYPRGSMKSSAGIFDIIQWVLLDFKIRILVLSAADDLASNIVDEARGFFVIKEACLSLMNLFFSEHCLLEKDLPATGIYISPAWAALQIKRREPTIMSRGVTSSVSGFHFEVFHGDDVVETRNSGSEEQCISVRKKYGITRKILRTFGYTNLLGTRYHESDLYGDILSKAEIGDFTTEEISICEHKTRNIGKGIEILVGAAMTIKQDAEMELVKYNIPRLQWFRKVGEKGVVLLLPKILTYDTCLVSYEEDPEAFETQQRQNVTPPTQQSFTREIILKSTINWMDLPLYGRITHCWDLNGGKGKKDNDMCVGTSCLWDSKGVGYITDLVCSNYPTHISIAQAVVQFAVKHHPDVVSIEDSLGMRMLEPTIWAEADIVGDEYVKSLVRRIYWRPVDTSKDAKKNRIGSLYPLILYGRMKFASTLPERERMIEQFIKPVTKSSKNDIPDCISFQTHFMPHPPTSEQDRKRIEEELKEQRIRVMEKSTWEMLFTENQYQDPINYEVQKEEEAEFRPLEEPEGLENILGFGL